MDAGTLRGLFTVVMLILFIAICFWAWSGRRKNTFDEMAHIPLEPDELDQVEKSTDESV